MSFFVLQWGGLEKVGSPQANSNNPVNCLKGRGRVGKRERSRASPVIRSGTVGHLNGCPFYFALLKYCWDNSDIGFREKSLFITHRSMKG